MQELDQVLGSNGTDLSGIAARFGLSPDQAQAALGALMPAVVGGFQKRADADELAPATNAGNAAEPDTDAGNDVLAHIFGSKDVSHQVADHAQGQSGVSSVVLRAMLPVVAAMVARHLAGPAGAAAAAPAGGGIGGILGSILGGGSGGGGLGGLGGLLGGAGGNPLDRILARAR